VNFLSPLDNDAENKEKSLVIPTGLPAAKRGLLALLSNFFLIL
jgi:hypothetical protein